jgi:hypothetical protein
MGQSQNEEPARHDARPDGEVELSATATAAAPQHMQALAQANRVRLARADLKRQVSEGEIGVSEVVLSCPWEAESMAIADLLMSQHRWGRTRCRRFLASIPMSETKTIGSMTDRQRHALAALLGGDPAGTQTGDGLAMSGLSW